MLLVALLPAALGCEQIIGADFSSEPPIIARNSAADSLDANSEEPPAGELGDGTDTDEAAATASARPQVCEAGVLQCEGRALQLCTENGVAWVTLELCASEALCMSGDNPGCSPAVCAPGNLRCNDNVLELCAPDSTGWNGIETCETAAHCSTSLGTCTELPCAGGDVQCSGAQLQACLDDGTGWDTLAECATPGLCDPSTAQCLEPACEAGETACNGSDFMRCNIDRSGWELDTECATAALCDNNAGCSAPACETGSYRCDGAELQRCNDDREGWDSVDSCTTAALCNASAQACDDAPCLPGQQRCNGTDIVQCNQDATGFDELESCVSAALCVVEDDSASCAAPICEPAEYRCSEASLQRCREAQDGWDDVESCASAALCNAAEISCDPPVCESEDFRCVGQTLEGCSPDLTGYELTEECGSSSICDPNAGTCVDACPIGTDRCQEDNVEDCAAIGLVAERRYTLLSGGTLARIDFDDVQDIVIPTHFDVIVGNAGNQWAGLTFTGGDSPIYCRFRGGSPTAIPLSPADMAAGQRYEFEYCAAGTLSSLCSPGNDGDPIDVTAGDVVSADSARFFVCGGAANQGSTSASWLLQRDGVSANSTEQIGEASCNNFNGFGF